MATVAGLRPGVQPVTVVHQVEVPGAAGTGLRPGGESKPLAVMVRPAIGALTASAAAGPTDPARTVTVAVTPLPSADQSAELTLEATTGSARRASRTFTIAGANLVFSFPDLPVGTWLVRLAIDGAGSLPSMTGGVYAGPTVVTT